MSGRMDLVLEEDVGAFVARPGSTYAYDLEHVGCAPSTHEEGTLETVIQPFPDDGVAQALISGGIGDDVDLTIFFDDSWVVTCPGGPALPEGTVANAFPGRGTSQGRFSAIHDGSGDYTVSCDRSRSIDNDGIVITGRVEGTLSPVAASP